MSFYASRDIYNNLRMLITCYFSYVNAHESNLHGYRL